MSTEQNVRTEIEPTEKKDVWDILKILGIVVIAPLIAFVGTIYTNALKEQEINVKNIELAVDILKQESDKTDKDIRQWAIDTINEYSKVKLTNEAQEALKESPIVSSISGIRFDLNIMKDFASREDVLRLVGYNDNPEGILIESVTILGTKDSGCEETFRIDSMFSGYSSSIAPILSKKELFKCLNTDKLTNQGYEFAEVSLKPALDMSYLIKKGGGMSSRNLPFAVKVEYRKDSSKASSLFGVHLHFVQVQH